LDSMPSDEKSAPSAASPPDHWIIGVGASAGGLEALTAFVRALPYPLPGALVIAQHLAPHARSMLTELLSRHTSIPLMAAEDSMQLTLGRIIVVPPGYDATVDGDTLRLHLAGLETRPKPSVDTLFSSLADSLHERAVGIVLSGTGSDGADGMRRIKESGGRIYTQTSESAKYDGMPRASFDTGLVDKELPPDRLGAELFGLLATQPDLNVQHVARHEAIAADPFDSILEEQFQAALQKIRTFAGNDFTQYKASTIKRRLARRMTLVGAPSLEAYLERLEKSPGEAQRLAQELLVSVTSFFRDPEVFEALRPLLADAVMKKPPMEEFRVWAAGCATGEEAYTLAILLCELAEEKAPDLRIRIFATDLDTSAIGHARRGVYSDAETRRLPDAMLNKYFQPHALGFEVKKALRDVIVFANQDLVQNPPFVKLDFVSCRNVLIYFSTPLQTRVVEMFHYALRRGGLLLLGASEGVASDAFEALDKKLRIYVRKDVATRPMLPPALSKDATALSRSSSSTSNAPRRSSSPNPPLQDIALTHLLRRKGIAAAVVDGNARIVHIIGELSRYVRFPQGSPDFRLTNVVAEDVSVELNILLRKASREHLTDPANDRAGEAYVSVVHDHPTLEGKAYRIEVEPLGRPFDASHCLVSFSEVDPRYHFSVAHDKWHKGNAADVLVALEAVDAAAAAGVDAASASVVDLTLSPAAAARFAELEEEVANTRAHLRSVIEELEIANEEMQALNEEMSATNEELQSSNEELETTNEELQSSNEELTTLNEELGVRTSELRFANTSLENIQASMGSPLVVVDTELRIQRYNDAVAAVFHLTRADVGLPITHASSVCELPDLEERIQRTLRTGVSEEMICTAGKGTFQMRVHACRDEGRRILGAVLVFFDNTDLIKLQRRLEVSESRMRAMLDGAATPISVKDTLGRYLLANNAFLKAHRFNEESLLDRTDRELFDAETANMLRDNDLEVLLKNEVTERREHLGKDNATSRCLLSSRFPLTAPGEANPYAVGTVSIDVTEQVVAQEELEKSQRRYRAIVEDQAVFVCRFDREGALTFTNGAFREFFGWGFEPGRPRSFYSLLEADDFEKVQGDLASLSRSEPTLQHETRVSGGPGIHAPPRWVRWIHRGLFSGDNTKLEIQTVGFDVTASHDRTIELMGKETLFSNVLEHTADFLTVYRCVGDEFFLESFNRSAAREMSTSSSLVQGATRLEGLNLRDLTAPSQLSLVLERFRAVVRSGTPVTFEELEEAPGGPRYLSTSVVPLRGMDSSIGRVAALSRDITRLKRAEEALRDEKRKADVANRAKSDFLAAMSHELRTPLNVITGMAQVLGRAQLPETNKRPVEAIQRSSKVLLDLIEDVLDLSKIEAGKVNLDAAPFSPAHLAVEVEQAFREQTVQKGLRLTIECAVPEGRQYVGDASRVRQLMVNFMGNAIKFTERGSIDLRVAEQTDLGGGMCNVLVSVRDTGIGIRKEDSSKVFKRFSQVDSGTSRKFGGTGLGLSICKELVEIMGGTVGFDSAEGEGSLFWFTLPLAVATEPVEATENAEIRKRQDGHANVLAVDDNADSLALLRIVARERDWNLVTAESGQAALDILENRMFDVVLMDMQMPGLDGLETTRRLRRMQKPASGVPVIAFTANAMRTDREKCLAAGMNDYITKPIDIALLCGKVDEWTAELRGRAVQAAEPATDEATAGGTASVGATAGARAGARALVEEEVEK